MAVTRVTPDEAYELVKQGWTYVDVRSVPEYEKGHPLGAYNVPLNHFYPGRGMAANPEFLEVMERAFARDTEIVLGCRSGSRSLRAAQKLVDAGFANVVDMRGGFGGETDRASGKVACEGWESRQLPVGREPQSGRSYRDLTGE